MLFNKDTFYPVIEVNSIYLHDTRRELPDQVMEGDPGWVLQGVLSRASFRRRPLGGQKTFTALSLHIGNIYARKRGIAKELILTIRAVMLGQHIDLVAGEISTGQRGGATMETTSVPLRKPLRTALCQRRWALHRCGDLVRSQATVLTDVCGFHEPPESDRYWKVRLHCAFSIPHKALGLRPTDQSCHHETWLHLEFVDWRSAQSHHEGHDRRILVKERPAPYHHGQQKRRISDIMSDQSLSS